MLMSHIGQRLKHNWHIQTQDMRGRYVIQVLIIACVALIVTQFSISIPIMRLMTGVMFGLLLALLLFFLRGGSVNAVVYIGASLGTVYLCLMTVVEGGIYSSSLVWLPMLALVVFLSFDRAPVVAGWP